MQFPVRYKPQTNKALPQFPLLSSRAYDTIKIKNLNPLIFNAAELKRYLSLFFSQVILKYTKPPFTWIHSGLFYYVTRQQCSNMPCLKWLPDQSIITKIATTFMMSFFYLYGTRFVKISYWQINFTLLSVNVSQQHTFHRVS